MINGNYWIIRLMEINIQVNFYSLQLLLCVVFMKLVSHSWLMQSSCRANVHMLIFIIQSHDLFTRNKRSKCNLCSFNIIIVVLDMIFWLINAFSFQIFSYTQKGFYICFVSFFPQKLGVCLRPFSGDDFLPYSQSLCCCHYG